MRKEKREKRIESGLRRAQPKGFTIVELMIATAVFSVVLLLCATAIVQVGRMFYKGTIVNNTQTVSRSVINDISQAVQFGDGNDDASFYPAPGSATYSGVSVQSQCVGGVRYSYFLRSKSLGSNPTDQLPHILWKDRVGAGGACEPRNITISDPGGTGGQELLGNGMRLAAFAITPPTSPSTSWKISISVAYGTTDDVFTKNGDNTPNYDQCTANNQGGQFCSVSAITTYVTRRL